MEQQGSDPPSKANSSTIKDVNYSEEEKYQTMDSEKTVTGMINETKEEMYKQQNEFKQDTNKQVTELKEN
jgi:hypothetical protein